jgi:septal ring factor EnvC (AmiA/AmiB activator)
MNFRLKYPRILSGAGISRFCACLLLLCLSATSFSQSKSDLQKQRDELNKKISFTKKLIDEAKKNKQITNNEILFIRKQINLRQQLISNLNAEITGIGSEISDKEREIAQLETEISEMKEEYANMIRQAYKTRNACDRLAFLIASESFNQAFRRYSLLQQYADVRKKQVERIVGTQDELKEVIHALEEDKTEKEDLLGERESEASELEQDKAEQQSSLNEISKEESKLRKQQQQHEADRQRINKAIERIIEEELRAEKSKNNGVFSLTPEGKIISENFERNKGNLPWPVLRGVITRTFGTQPHASLPGITIDSKGIDIETEKDASVMAIFGGEVTSVFAIPGAGENVIVTHGAYKTVYTHLKNVSVSKGDQVSAKEKMGTVLADGNRNIAHLEIWKVSSKGGVPQNPQYWISK